MSKTNATPADFKRLVRKIVENPDIQEYRTDRGDKTYKVVYVFLYHNNEVILRLEYATGEVSATVLGQHFNVALVSWTPEELGKLAQAAQDARTIIDAFYSVDQSTTRQRSLA